MEGNFLRPLVEYPFVYKGNLFDGRYHRLLALSLRERSPVLQHSRLSSGAEAERCGVYAELFGVNVLLSGVGVWSLAFTSDRLACTSARRTFTPGYSPCALRSFNIRSVAKRNSAQAYNRHKAIYACSQRA